MKKQPYLSNVLFTLILAVGILTACGERTDTAHEHEHGASVTVTRWTDSLEVFIEYEQPMHAGPVTFTVHLTRLADWSPVDGGTAVLYIRQPDGRKSGTASDQLIAPGMFRLRHDAPSEGSYELLFVYRMGTFADTCALPPLQLPVGNAGDLDGTERGGITYLKEQQWKEDFSTEAVRFRPIHESIAVGGIIEAAAGRLVEIAAPVNGMLLNGRSASLPASGSRVTAGSTLAILSPDPGNINGLAQVRAEYHNAAADFERVKTLHARGAISEKRFDEARNRYASAKAGYDLLHESRYWESGEGDATLRIRTPISGFVEEVAIRPGQHLSAGQKLFVVADPSRLLLRASVPAARAAALRHISDAWFTIEGFPERFRVSRLNGRVVARGNVIDPGTRTLDVSFEFDNPGGALAIGLFAETRIETGEAGDVLSVPRTALIDEGDGVTVVFVQRDGESFERRPVTIGRVGEAFVEVRDGVKAGERVVSAGAPRIRLASVAGSVPAHGHTH